MKSVRESVLKKERNKRYRERQKNDARYVQRRKESNQKYYQKKKQQENYVSTQKFDSVRSLDRHKTDVIKVLLPESELKAIQVLTHVLDMYFTCTTNSLNHFQSYAFVINGNNHSKETVYTVYTC